MDTWWWAGAGAESGGWRQTTDVSGVRFMFYSAELQCDSCWPDWSSVTTRLRHKGQVYVKIKTWVYVQDLNCESVSESWTLPANQ